MPKRAPPESAVGATVVSTVAKHVSAMIGSDTETSVRAALDIFVVETRSVRVGSAHAFA